MARRDDEFLIKLLIVFAAGFVWLIIEFFRSWANARANANPRQRTTYNGADAVHNNCVYIYEIPSHRAVKIGKGHPESRMQAYCELHGLQPRHSSLRYWDLGNYDALDAERKVHNELELRRISFGGTREVFAIGNRSYDEIRNQMDRILSPYASSTNYRVKIREKKWLLAVDLGYGLALAAVVTLVVWAL